MIRVVGDKHFVCLHGCVLADTPMWSDPCDDPLVSTFGADDVLSRLYFIHSFIVFFILAVVWSHVLCLFLPFFIMTVGDMPHGVENLFLACAHHRSSRQARLFDGLTHEIMELRGCSTASDESDGNELAFTYLYIYVYIYRPPKKTKTKQANPTTNKQTQPGSSRPPLPQGQARPSQVKPCQTKSSHVRPCQIKLIRI